ncbi:MAG: aspartate carbamoyltransferase [Anaerolineales bacterium]|nr:aspartate carbamoyltransferase [Anaerolineales bacterium]
MSILSGVDILRADMITKTELDLILETAARFESELNNKGRLANMDGKILATLFFEPSTRTRLSFEAAMHRLGGQVITVADAKTSSAAKGESLADTARTVEGYADVIVIRHPQKGSAEQVSDAVAIPVINAGDGAGQHPTQALLDVYTIQKEKGRLEGLAITLVGDLKYGRTVHSLSYVLASLGFRLFLVSPESLKMPADIVKDLRAMGAKITESSDLTAATKESDVVYMTRIQRERFEDPAEYERLKGIYVVDMTMIKRAKPGITIMHPLPRVDEINVEVDSYRGAAYFRQAANGVFVRMALLALVAGRE